MEKENVGDSKANSSNTTRRTSARLSLSKTQPNNRSVKTNANNKGAISSNVRTTAMSRFNRPASMARVTATTNTGRANPTIKATNRPIISGPKTTASARTSSTATNTKYNSAVTAGRTTSATKRPLPATTFGARNAAAVSQVGKRTMVSNSRVVSAPGQRASWDVRGKYSDLQKKYEDMQKDHEIQINEIKKEKELIEEQSLISISKANQLEVDLNDANSMISSLKNEIDNFPKALAEKEQHISTLLEKLSDQQVITANLTKTVEQLTASRDNVQAKYDQLRFDHSNTTTNVQLLEDKLNCKDEQLKQAALRIESLESDLVESKKQLGKQDIERRYLHHRIMELKGTVRVACRIRPVLPTEQDSTVYSIEYNSVDSTMRIASTQSRDNVSGEKVDSIPYSFRFDNFFGAHSSQKNVFDEIEPLIQSALDGYNVCIFAYGQTGSGKTFTMEGDTQYSDKHGMIPRSVNKIFESMPPMERNGWSYRIYVSFIEIYNENLRDLLGSMDEKTGDPKIELKVYQPSSSYSSTNNNVTIGNLNKVNDVEITNLKVVQVHNPQEVHELLEIAHKNRTVGATKCNINSSRSHSVFQLKLVGSNDLLKETSVGKINLVDLAGSERLKESQAEGVRLIETRHINKSLSTLRKVMQSLSDKDSHVPFRDSKLTHLLQTSLGGNSKSLMFVNISPLEEHFNESVNSLRFAAKVNEVQIGVATQNKKKLAY